MTRLAAPPLIVLPLIALLAGCATQPQMGVHVNTVSGRVSPSVSTNLGGLAISANGSGGTVGTRFGPIGLSAGF